MRAPIGGAVLNDMIGCLLHCTAPTCSSSSLAPACFKGVKATVCKLQCHKNKHTG